MSSFSSMHFPMGQSDSAHSIPVVLPSDFSLPIVLSNDTNYGVVGANTLRTAAQIGNATGAAVFGTGVRSAQVLRVTIATDDVLPVSQSGTWSVGITNLPTTVDTNVGAAGASTLRVAFATGSTTAATQSGTWNVGITGTVPLPTGAATETTLAALNAKVADDFGVLSAAVRTAAQVGNATGAAAFGTGARSAQVLRVTIATDDVVPASQSGTWSTRTQDGSGNAITSTSSALDVNVKNTSIAATTTITASTITGQNVGRTAFGSLTTSFVTILTTSATARLVYLFNSTDTDVSYSLDGGTTENFRLEAGESVSLDLGTSGRQLAASTVIQVKYTGTAPTVGSARVTVLG